MTHSSEDNQFQGARIPKHEITPWLIAWGQDPLNKAEAIQQVLRVVIHDLRRMARIFLLGQAQNHTLEQDALINEVYLRLIGLPTPPQWKDRREFFAYTAMIMRRILINYAQCKGAAKRGGANVVPETQDLKHEPGMDSTNLEGLSLGFQLPPSADLLDLDRALGRLQDLDSRQGKIVELRYFLGLTVEETAIALGLSSRTIKREWNSARLWLLRALERKT